MTTTPGHYVLGLSGFALLRRWYEDDELVEARLSQLLELAAKAEDDVIGTDLTPAMLEKARENVAGAEFREGRFEALPIEDASVDLVTSTLAVCHADDLGPVFRRVRTGPPSRRTSVRDRPTPDGNVVRRPGVLPRRLRLSLRTEPRPIGVRVLHRSNRCGAQRVRTPRADDLRSGDRGRPDVRALPRLAASGSKWHPVLTRDRGQQVLKTPTTLGNECPGSSCVGVALSRAAKSGLSAPNPTAMMRCSEQRDQLNQIRGTSCRRRSANRCGRC